MEIAIIEAKQSSLLVIAIIFFLFVMSSVLLMSLIISLKICKKERFYYFYQDRSIEIIACSTVSMLRFNHLFQCLPKNRQKKM